MMKLTTLVLALCLCAGLAVAGDAEPWFDMANCDMCKHLLTPEGMLHEIGWEHHLTSTGALSVTVVPASRAKDWAAAKAAMMAAGEKMHKGEATKMCNFCKSMGALMTSGKMQMEQFETIGGEVMLVSSADAATVEAIHKHYQRTMEELKKMEATAKTGTR
jgi:hypothetical protein